MLPKSHARILLEKYAVDNPTELEIEAIANAEKLIIREDEMSGAIGRITFSNGSGVITIKKDIKEVSQKRFTIAHEMGHFFNERGAGIKTNFDNLTNFYSVGGRERAANEFAAEFLMKSEWFTDFTKGKKLNIDLLKETASYFGVSLSAAALRYAEIGESPMAVIMSKNGIVQWSRINKYFPFTWIPNGYKVNSNSYAFDIFKKRGKGESQSIIHDEPEEVLADAWFWEDYNFKKDFYMIEQNFYMPGYDSIMTILWEI